MPSPRIDPSPLAARLATTALFVANGLAIGVWATAIPLVQRRLGLSPGALSLALLAMAAGAIATMPLAGWIAARLGGGERAAKATGLAFGAALALPGLAGDLGWLAAILVFVGAGNGAMDVAMNAHAAAVERRWGAPIMSSFHAAWSCGGLIGAGLGGGLIRLGAGDGGVLLAAAAATLALVAAALPFLGRGDPLHRDAPAFVLPSRRLIGLALIALLAMMSEGAMIDWSAIYLTDVAGVPPAGAAMGYAVFAAAMLTGRFIGDAAVARLGRARVIAAGAGVAGLGVALDVAFAHSEAAILVGLALTGVGLANMAPAVFSRAAATGPSPAIGIAMAATLGYAGLLVGPPLIGAIASLASLRVSFLALVAALAAIVPLAARAGGADERATGGAASR